MFELYQQGFYKFYQNQKKDNQMKGYSEHHRQQLKKGLEYLDARKIKIGRAHV